MEAQIPKISTGMASLWETARAIEQEVVATSAGLDAIEGQRFLLRMLAASVDTYLEQIDFDRPLFNAAESPTRKMFADCPDTDYLRAPIQLGDGRVYRLWGRMPLSTLYAGFILYGRGGRIGNRLTEGDLDLDEDGRFEIFISTGEQPGAWLQGEGDETAVMVRQYFSDREAQPPLEVQIELMGDPPPPQPMDAGAIPSQLQRAERMLKAIFNRTLQARQLATMAAVNRFIQVPGEQLFPTPDNTYSAAWFRRTQGEEPLVRGRLPRARYFSVTLYNAWLESLDYQRHTVSLNHEQLHLEEDGSFRIVLSDLKPDHPNWLDTAGHGEGYVIARALLLEGDMPQLDLDMAQI